MTETSVRGVKLDYLPSPTSLRCCSEGKRSICIGFYWGFGSTGVLGHLVRVIQVIIALYINIFFFFLVMFCLIFI